MLVQQGPRGAARRDEMMHLAHGRAEQAANRTMRAFLRRVLAACTDAVSLVSAAAVPDPFSAETARLWWETAAAENLLPELGSIWQAGYSDTSTIAAGNDAAITFLATVRDRLSPRVGPSLPTNAFDTARRVLSEELSAGSSTEQVAQRLAAEFSWDNRATYWRTRKTDAGAQIDTILDVIGPPGDPSREFARKSDPRVSALQQISAEATKHIDAVESTWRVRATAIARTETTGAFNFGSLHAYWVEGVECLRWLATRDLRTRDSHRDADGDVIALGGRFTLTDNARLALLRMPGDPTGPAWAVINCRCTTVAADCP